MTITLADYYISQLENQASLHDLSSEAGMDDSAWALADFYMAMHDSLPVTTCLEVGANKAFFSRRLKQNHPDKNVFAFEANELACQAFGVPIQQDGVILENVAVSDHSGQSDLYLYSFINGVAVPTTGTPHALRLRQDKPAEYTVRSVPCIHLDARFAAPEYADAAYSLWIDAEGESGAVLEGAQALLSKVQALYVRVESVARFPGQMLDTQIIEFLLHHDFIPIARDFSQAYEYHIVFIKKHVRPQMEACICDFFQFQAYRKSRVAAQQIPFPAPAGGKRRALQCSWLISAAGYTGDIKEYRRRRICEALDAIPLLRPRRDHFDPHHTVVVCGSSELADALQYYSARYPVLPVFYVMDRTEESLKLAADHNAQTELLQKLRPSQDIQLYVSASRILYNFHMLTVALERLGIQKYAIEADSVALFAAYPAREAKDWDLSRMCHIWSRLADDASKRAFLGACKARITGEPGYIPIALYPQYVHPLVQAGRGDVVCEGGSLDGKTTAAFAAAVGPTGKVYAFEPDPDAFVDSKNYLESYANVDVLPVGLWEEQCSMRMARGTTGNTRISLELEKCDLQCDFVSIDGFLGDRCINALKLDVEGAELSVLRGGAKSIIAHRPKLLISIYHSGLGNDLLNVPEYMISLDTRYKYYVGHHTAWAWETILYAIE